MPSRPIGYCLKPNYESRLAASYFDDVPSDLEWQPDVYRLAHQLARRSGASHIIDIGAGSGKKLAPIARERHAIVIDHGRNLARARETLGGAHTFIEHDLEAGMPAIDEDVLRDSVVICADVIEHLASPALLLEALASCSRIAKIVLLSTPDRVRGDGIGDFGPPANPAHVREWAIDELDALLRAYDFGRYMIGYTISSDRDRLKHTALAASGTLAAPPRAGHAKVLTVMSESPSDGAANILRHYLAQGSDVVWLCAEQTAAEELVQAETHLGAARAWVLPWARDEDIDLRAVRVREPRTADYDWTVRATGREHLWPPWPGVSLAEALSAVAAHGYDAVTATALDVFVAARGETKFCFGESIEPVAARRLGGEDRTFPLNFTLLRHREVPESTIERRRVHAYHPPTLRNDYLVELLAGPDEIERGA